MEIRGRLRSIIRAGQTDSRVVAALLNKRHCDVLRDIERLDCSPGFRRKNFGVYWHMSKQEKRTPHMAMTVQGFSFLLMGYRGKRAAEVKEIYLDLVQELFAAAE